MEEVSTEWNDWSVGGSQGDLETSETLQAEGSTVDSLDSKSNDQTYDTGFGGEDDYMNDYALYDGYDSYNENNADLSDDADYMETNENRNGSEYYSYPNGKEGMASCERCGNVGIKHAFYSKSKRFCSLSCSRGYATAQREGKPLQLFSKEPLAQLSDVYTKQPNVIKKSKQQQRPKPQVNTIPSSYNKQKATKSFEWGPYLQSSGCSAASVACFKHCPMSDCWENINFGMKVEVINRYCDLPQTVFWIASVVQTTGYKALMRYEGFGSETKYDFWINLCSKDVHPVGWCATIGKPLVPPKPIQHRYGDWKDFLVKRLTGARTLPNNFYTKVIENLDNVPLKLGMKLEVVDKLCVSAMKVAIVDDVIGGRLRLQYVNSQNEGDDFWCHQKSSLIHPVCWSYLNGHKLHADSDYRNKAISKATTKKFDEWDCTWDMFARPSPLPSHGRFQVGMKLEAIDPLNLSTICVATVMQVLKNGYLMIGIDGSMAQDGSDWFCYHSGSTSIFPVGFCEINGIDLTSPRGYKGTFRWIDYLKLAQSTAAPVNLFNKEMPSHGFKLGMKLEAVDLMEPRLICIATVSRVVGRLLRIHFDGWEDIYDQWIDCESPDIYPVGWCEMVDYHLEGPKTKESGPPPQVIHSRKRKTKNQIYRGPRKKKKSKLTSKSYFDENDDMNMFPEHPLEGSIHPPHIALRPEEVAATLPPIEADIMNEDVKPNIEQLQAKVKQENDSSNEASIESGNVKSEENLQLGVILPSLPLEGTIKTETEITNPTRSQSTGSVEQVSGSQNITQSSVTSASVSQTTMNTDVIINDEPETVPPIANIYSLNAKPSGGSVQNSNSSTAVLCANNLLTPSPSTVVMHNIPRVVAGESELGDLPIASSQRITPELWATYDVCKFLRINDCGAYCDSFSKKLIDGSKFLMLTKEQIVNLTGMKVGPSLKIYDIIQQLKAKVATQSQP